MKSILILGSKGNLGSQLNKIFQDDYEVVAWDREEIDITDKELIIKKINDIKPSIIINAAAYNTVDKCEEDKKEFELAYKINGEAVGFLVEAALKVNAILIHYSTDYVFAGDKKEGYYEDDKPSPINKYGETKLVGEKEIISSSGKGLKWYLIRTSKLFGPRGKSSAAKPSFFDLMIDLAASRDELEVVDAEVSSFTYTPDLARATRELIEEKYGYGIYHLVNEGACTWYEAACELFKILQKDIKIKPVPPEHFPRPAKRPPYSILLNTKFKKLRNWREALKEYLKSKS